MNEKYEEHIKQCWNFSNKIVEKNLELDGVIGSNIKIKVFEKILTPFHYFEAPEDRQNQKPSEAQLKYAKSLKIKNPEEYTRAELSRKIKEALKDD